MHPIVAPVLDGETGSSIKWNHIPYREDINIISRLLLINFKRTSKTGNYIKTRNAQYFIASSKFQNQIEQKESLINT